LEENKAQNFIINYWHYRPTFFWSENQWEIGNIL